MSGGDEDEFHSAEDTDTMEAVASYWSKKKNMSALGHLECKVFSWSIRDIFNRDLLRHQVTSIEHRTRWWFCRDCLHTLFFLLDFRVIRS